MPVARHVRWTQSRAAACARSASSATTACSASPMPISDAARVPGGLVLAARLRVLGQPSETRSIVGHAATDESHGLQGERIGQRVEREVPLLTAHDDFAAKQLRQVLRDELVLHAEDAREIGDRARAVRQDFEQLKSDGMPKHAQAARSNLPNVARGRNDRRRPPGARPWPRAFRPVAPGETSAGRGADGRRRSSLVCRSRRAGHPRHIDAGGGALETSNPFLRKSSSGARLPAAAQPAP